LRRFEIRLLQSCGLGIDMARTADRGDEVRGGGRYYCVAEHGVLEAKPPVRHCSVSGDALRGLAGLAAWDAAALREAKTLMRFLLAHYLQGQPLRARQLFTPTANGRD
jgi:DNA repair protein RecO (recombination protein O)